MNLKTIGYCRGKVMAEFYYGETAVTSLENPLSPAAL